MQTHFSDFFRVYAFLNWACFSVFFFRQEIRGPTSDRIMNLEPVRHKAFKI